MYLEILRPVVPLLELTFFLGQTPLNETVKSKLILVTFIL